MDSVSEYVRIFRQYEYPEDLTNTCIKELFFAYLSFVANYEYFLNPDGSFEDGFMDNLENTSCELHCSMRENGDKLDQDLSKFILQSVDRIQSCIKNFDINEKKLT